MDGALRKLYCSNRATAHESPRILNRPGGRSGLFSLRRTAPCPRCTNGSRGDHRGPQEFECLEKPRTPPPSPAPDPDRLARSDRATSGRQKMGTARSSLCDRAPGHGAFLPIRKTNRRARRHLLGVAAYAREIATSEAALRKACVRVAGQSPTQLVQGRMAGVNYFFRRIASPDRLP